MQISIQYKAFYKTIDCPTNTIAIGLKCNGKLVVLNNLHYVFENIEMTTYDTILPDETKFKFYFYTCNHPEIIKLQQNTILPSLKIVGENFIIEANKKQPL